MTTYSVIIPLYNKEATIARAIDSVLAQSVADFELIVVDDGSTDKGAEIVKKIPDRRIRLIQQQNQGPSAARNRGIREARSELIAFLDADDTWELSFLETISRLRKNYPQAGIYATAYNIVSPNNTMKKAVFCAIPEDDWEGPLPNFWRSLAEGAMPLTSSSVCIPKQTFLNVGEFPAGIGIGEDTDLWIRIALKYPIAFSSKPCATYHQNVSNMASWNVIPDKKDLSFAPILQDAIETKKVDTATIPHIQELFARHYYLRSVQFLLANQIKEARSFAARSNPRRIKYKIRKALVLFLSVLPYPVIKFLGTLIWGVKK